MKFPFRDFWGRLIAKFGDFTYKSISDAISYNRRLRNESELKEKLPGMKEIPVEQLYLLNGYFTPDKI